MQPVVTMFHASYDLRRGEEVETACGQAEMQGNSNQQTVYSVASKDTRKRAN